MLTRNLYFSVRNHISEAIWWVKHRIVPRHRYHIVRTGLKPGYYDKDDLMLHACFDLLKRFVEIEKPFEWFDTENSHNKDAWIEIRALYDWWTKERPSRELRDPYREGCSIAVFREHIKFVEDCDIEDQANLHRLVDVRRHLWT